MDAISFNVSLPSNESLPLFKLRFHEDGVTRSITYLGTDDEYVLYPDQRIVYVDKGLYTHFDSSEAEQGTHLGSPQQSEWYGLAPHQADAQHPTGSETKIACAPCIEENTVCKPSQSKDEQTVRRDDTDFSVCNQCLTRFERSRRLDSDNKVVYEEGGFHPSRCGFEETRALQLLAKTQRVNEKAKAKRASQRKLKAAQSELSWIGD